LGKNKEHLNLVKQVCVQQQSKKEAEQKATAEAVEKRLVLALQPTPTAS